MSNRLCKIYVQVVNGVKNRATQQEICEQSGGYRTIYRINLIERK
jgi:hypothetical protein